MGKFRKICNLLTGRNNLSIPFRACDLKKHLTLISPEEEQERIRAWLKKRRENNEIPINFPERPKIFIAVRQVNWEEGGLVDSWREIADVIYYDCGEKYDPYSRNWQRKDKHLFNEELLKRVGEEHSRQPIQIFFSYLSGRSAFPETIRKISEMGIITINIGFDDTRSFQGKKEKTGWTGNAEICFAFDVCITCQNRSDIVKYLEIGARPIFFPPGGNHYFWASNSPSPNRTIPVSFIGQNQNYGRRQKVIDLLRKEGVPVATYGIGWPEGEISQEKMLEIYSNSLLTIGFGYISSTDLLGFKGRDFEVPLTGVAYLTTYHEELARCFLSDQEMVFYSDEKDLVKKVKYYLGHLEEALEIGLAGRKKALAEHTWTKRWEKILEVCR